MTNPTLHLTLPAIVRVAAITVCTTLVLTAADDAPPTDPAIVRLEAQTARLNAETAAINAARERDRAIGDRLAGGAGRPDAPTGKYTQNGDGVSPLALAVAHEALFDLADAVRADLKKKLPAGRILVFLGAPEQPPTFWHWFFFQQRVRDIEKQVDKIDPKKIDMNTMVVGEIAAAVELASAIPAAFQALAALWRRDVTETTAPLTLADGALRDAVLALPQKSGWEIYHSLGALTNRAITRFDGLATSALLKKMDALARRAATKKAAAEAALKNDPKDEAAKKLKAQCEEIEEAIAGVRTQLAAEGDDKETGLVRLLREELLVRILFGNAPFEDGNTTTFDQLAENSKVRFVRLDFVEQAQSRVETKSFWSTRYHYEATLSARYAIFTPTGRQEASGVIVRTILRRPPERKQIDELAPTISISMKNKKP